MWMVSDVDGLEFALQGNSGIVILDELIELIPIAYVEFAEAEDPLVDID